MPYGLDHSLDIIIFLIREADRLFSLCTLSALFDLALFFLGQHTRGAHVVGIIALHEIAVRIADRLLEIGSELLHILIASVRALLTALEDDLVHTVRDVRIELSGRRHRFLDVADRDRYGRLPVKRHFACEHLIQSHAERIDIALLVAESASGLFRGGIVHGSHDIGSDRVAGRRLGNTEIRDLDLSFAGNDDILRLDISVDNVVSVGRFESHGDLQSDRDRLFIAQISLLAYVIFQCDAVHKFHDNIVNALFLTDVIDIYDIGMHQACRSLRLHPEFGYKIRVFRKLLLQDLDRHITVQCVVLGFIYIRHTACADLFKDLVAVRDQHADLNHFIPPLPWKSPRAYRH